MSATPEELLKAPELEDLLSDPKTKLFDVDDKPIAVLEGDAWRCDDNPLTRFDIVSTFEAPRVRSLDAFKRLIISRRASP